MGKDKRKAEWLIKESAFRDIGECFKSDTALCQELNTNTNTWRKIVQSEKVKRQVAKEVLSNFLTFLLEVKGEKKAIDASRHHKPDIDKAISKYLGAGPAAEWTDLAIPPL